MSVQVSAKFVGGKELTSWLRKLGPEAEKIGRGVVFKEAERLRSEAIKELKEKKSRQGGMYEAVDTGALGRSYGVDMDHRPGSEVVATIGSNADYATAIEFGRQPGSMPPVRELLSWVKRKLLKKKGFGRKASDRANTMDQVEGVAYTVADKIRERGTDPHPHLVPAFDRVAKDLDREVARALDRLGR